MVRRHLTGFPLVFATLVASASSVALTASLSATVSIIALVGLVVVIILCPLLFVHWQSYKETIHGPWDEAVPSI